MADRLIDPSELMASSDVAQLLGVGKAAVSNWKQRYPDFPDPVTTVAGGRTDLYLYSEVISWFTRTHPELTQAILQKGTP